MIKLYVSNIVDAELLQYKLFNSCIPFIFKFNYDYDLLRKQGQYYEFIIFEKYLDTVRELIRVYQIDLL